MGRSDLNRESPVREDKGTVMIKSYSHKTNWLHVGGSKNEIRPFAQQILEDFT